MSKYLRMKNLKEYKGFKLGHMVQHKTGGPQMVISSIMQVQEVEPDWDDGKDIAYHNRLTSSTLYGGCETVFYCTWWDKGRIPPDYGTVSYRKDDVPQFVYRDFSPHQLKAVD